jgi:preprotein translocase SecE subunit
VVIEVKKCEWPPRQNLVETTFVVIVSLLMMAAFIGVSDKFLVTMLKWIIQVK